MQALRRFVICTFLTVIVAAGCSGESGDAPEAFPVSGTVNLDGQALPEATIVFSPIAGGRPSSAQTDSGGNYELRYSREQNGAPPGDYIVRITTGSTDDETVIEEKVPAKYNLNANDNPDMKVTVKEESNTIDFNLESDGEIVQPGEQDDAAANAAPDVCF